MNNFEERYTAWLDGALDEAERERFEAELPDREGARREAAEWKRLRGDLRAWMEATPLPHADFVNSQVRAAIRPAVPAEKPRGAAGWFPVGRLAWAGSFLLGAAAVLSAVLLPRNGGMPTNEQFIAQVVEARAADPKLGAYAFAAPGGKGAVLWVNDAGFIPADEKIR